MGDTNIIMLDDHITNYIENDLSELALEINSPWGSGKTHSVNEYAGSHQEGITWINVSVNGVKADEMEELFISSFIQSLDNDMIGSIVKITKKVEKFIPATQSIGPFSINLPISSLRNKILDSYTSNADRNDDKLVFVIDDVERIQEVTALKKLFGIVSILLQEKLNAKVIILVNEDQLGNDEKSFFLENREKIINHIVTVTKKQNKVIEELIDEVITSQDASIKTVITSNIMRITQQNNSDNINYRTIRVLISDVNVLIQSLNETNGYNALPEVQKNEFLHDLTLALFTILVNFREKSVDFTDSKKISDELTSLRYLTSNNINAITDFVTQGTRLNTQQLVTDFSRRYSLFKTNKSFDKLQNFRKLNQIDLSNLQNEIVSSDTFISVISNVSDLLSLYILIDFLHEKELWLSHEDDFHTMNSKIKDALLNSELQDLHSELANEKMFHRSEKVVELLDKVIKEKASSNDATKNTINQIKAGNYEATTRYNLSSQNPEEQYILRSLIADLGNDSLKPKEKLTILSFLNDAIGEIPEPLLKQYIEVSLKLTTDSDDAVLKFVAEEHLRIKIAPQVVYDIQIGKQLETAKYAISEENILADQIIQYLSDSIEERRYMITNNQTSGSKYAEVQNILEFMNENQSIISDTYQESLTQLLAVETDGNFKNLISQQTN